MSSYFYLANLDCYACVWVCEKALKKLYPGIVASINLSQKKLYLRYEKNSFILSDVANDLDRLGYPVSPNISYRENDHSDYINLGVSFFCLMNIMLLAAADYLSEDLQSSIFYSLFRYISLLFTTIALALPARVFYKNAFSAILSFKLHLDIPISIALLSSYLYSAYSTILGHGEVYYDSVVAIIFFLTLGRLIQKKSMDKIQHKITSSKLLGAEFSKVVDLSGELSFIRNSSLKKGDTILCSTGSIVPVQSELLSRQCNANLEFLTGEMKEYNYVQGDTLASGSLITGEGVKLICLEDAYSSYIEKIRKSSEKLFSQKSLYLIRSEKIAHFLVVFVLFVSALIFLWNIDSPKIAFERVVATLLISCPCAFGLGAPLIIARAFDLGLKKGFIYKSQRAIERLPLINSAFFDKTGTLTRKNYLIELELLSTSLEKAEIYDYLRGLTNYSEHHICKSLDRLAGIGKSRKIHSFTEKIAYGVSYLSGATEVKIGRSEFVLSDLNADFSGTLIRIDDEIVARVIIEENVTKGAKNLMDDLKDLNIKTYILSGDCKKRVLNIANRLGIQRSGVFYELAPNEKLALLKREADSSIMIGNGINDSLAMSGSKISIAVNDSSEMAKASSDIVLLGDDLSSISDSIKLSRSCRISLLRCFLFSFVFNLVGISLAFMGLLKPVVAAILMPLSSLVVIYISSHWE